MNTIGQTNALAKLAVPVAAPMRQLAALQKAGAGQEVLQLKAAKTQKPEEVREKFTQFVGETFFGQMLKSMRSTVGKPAYFYGGHAEEMFQGQLDQTLSQQLTKVSADKFAKPMFERQFPQFAEAKPASGLDQLMQLQRR